MTLLRRALNDARTAQEFNHFFHHPERTMHNITSPDNTDPSIERQIQAKGLTAPRITPADVQANITSEWYFTADEGALGAYRANNDVFQSTRHTDAAAEPALRLLTFCVLVLSNGFTVTGESACASPENYDRDIGRRIARQNAEQKIWPLMGYQLRSSLANRVPE